MYKIILSDGTEIKNCYLNGDGGRYFKTEETINSNIFENNLDSVIIIDEDTHEREVLEDCKLGYLVENEDPEDGLTKWWFFIDDTKDPVLLLEKLSDSLKENKNDITDIQMALAEIYEALA